MFGKLRNVGDVAAWRLCPGCGACAAVCSNKAVTLVDVPDCGIRPLVASDKCAACGDCLKVCPGIGASHLPFGGDTIPELRREWGPVLECWEGYASDPEIRYKGSSGGVATALGLFCLEQGIASAVMHVKPGTAPLSNAASLSRTRADLLLGSGSRYGPAAGCEKVSRLAMAEQACVFVGKPCDVEAVRKLCEMKPAVAGGVALTISIFCAGTPSTSGTLALLKSLGVPQQDVQDIRYRGCGWPGATTIVDKDEMRHTLDYAKSWGDILSRFVPLRCRLCPSGTGEFADISCGDAWYRNPDSEELGWSLVLVRTQTGRRILQMAADSGHIRVQPVGSWTVAESQPSLLNKRRQLWGRLVAMRACLLPTPRFEGFSLFSNWWELRLRDKLRTVFGTFARIIGRCWMKPDSSYLSATRAVRKS